MRQAGTLESREAAQRFADYLLAQGVVARIEPSAERWGLWILDENQIDRAKQELAAFEQNPADSRYDSARQAAAEIRRREAARVQQAQKNVVEVRDGWSERPLGSGRVVQSLAVICIGVAVFTSLGGNVIPELNEHKPGLASALLISTNVFAPLEELLREPYFGLEQIAHGEVWRLVTPAFLHFGIPHIVFNLIALLQLGGAIEMRRGSVWFGVIVLVSAVISNLTQYFWAGPVFGGMSGVAYALFGYIWMQAHYVPNSGFFMPPQMLFMYVFWFFLCMTDTVGPIANAAHGAGLVVGCLFGVAPRWLGKR
jgi:GlpG protein